MIKFSMDDIGNYIMFVVGIGIIVFNIYDDVKKQKATKWVKESGARMQSMCQYALSKRISREGFVEMITRAKVELKYEVEETLGNGRHADWALLQVTNYLDRVARQVL